MFNFKLLFILLFINSYQVSAVAITGNTTGAFLITKNSSTGVTESESASFEWGNGSSVFDGQSSLEVIGVKGLSINNAQPFKVAELTYTNTNITSSSAFSSTFANVDLAMSLNFDSSNSTGTYQFKSAIDIVETDNSLPDSADSVSVILDNTNPFLSIDGQDYIFELLGFSNGNAGFNHVFVQPEKSSSSVDLYAQITAVPLPPAALLFLTSLSGLFISANRRKKG